jgi:hypothetical protein
MKTAAAAPAKVSNIVRFILSSMFSSLLCGPAQVLAPPHTQGAANMRHRTRQEMILYGT